MAVISKLKFEQYFGNAECYELLHPWTKNCLRANIYFLSICFFGSIKHFGLAYLISILLKSNHLTKSNLREELKCYLRTVVSSTLISSHCFIYICLLRKILGKMSYYTILTIPVFLGSLYIFIANKSKREIVAQVLLQMSFQVLIKMMEHNRILNRNLATDTFCFMITNAFLLYFLYEDKARRVATSTSFSMSSSSTTNGESNEKDSSKHIAILWPYQHSMSVEKIKTENPCFHFNDCIKFISNGAKTYFKMGCAFQLLTLTLEYSRKVEKSSQIFFKLLLKWSNIRPGLFLTSYATIYRFMTCWLCQKNKKSSKNYAFVGGFCSGISYILYPKLTSLLSILSATVTILLRRLEQNNQILTGKLAEITFCLCIAFLVHCRIFHTQYLHKTAIRFISSITSTQSDKISEQLHKLYQERF